MTILWAQYPNDCANYVQVCGNQDINLNVSGPGVQELYNVGCDSGENNSLWLHVNIEVGGTLGFTLIPSSNSINEDYDFWVFGPDVSCNNLGYSIRCSTTNPQGAGQSNNHTGMSGTETETSEGPGPDGNSFVRWLDTQAGETYFIVLDRPIGNSSFSLEWTGTAQLANPLEDVTINSLETIRLCDAGNDGVENYDLSQHDSEILADLTGIEITYHNNQSDATTDNNALTMPAQLSSGTYWARIENIATRCFETFSFTVDLGGLPIQPDTINICDTGNDGQENVDLEQANLFDSSLGYTVQYYENQTDAESGLANFISDYNQYTLSQNQQTIYVRVSNGNCIDYTTITLNLLSVPTPANQQEIVCNSELNNGTINLSSYSTLFSTQSADVVNYFESQIALNNGQSISNTAQYPLQTGQNQIYVSVSREGCIGSAILTLDVYDSFGLGEDEEIQLCQEEFPYELSVNPTQSYTQIAWSTGETQTESIQINETGTYTVIISTDDCEEQKTFNITERSAPQVTQIEVNAGDVVVYAHSDTLPIYYQLDDGEWQLSNEFHQLDNGLHYVKVRLENGCESIAYPTYILVEINNVITPNGDGYNDQWAFPGLENFPESTISIYDRWGKKIREQTAAQPFVWDGKYGGRKLPGTDYWYVIELGDGRKFTGHITIKNK